MAVHGTIPEDLLEEIQHDLEGTCRTLDEVIDAFDLEIDVDALEDRLLDAPFPVERSVCCEWWFACSDVAFDEARNGGVCAACEPEFEP